METFPSVEIEEKNFETLEENFPHLVHDLFHPNYLHNGKYQIGGLHTRIRINGKRDKGHITSKPDQVTELVRRWNEKQPEDMKIQFGRGNPIMFDKEQYARFIWDILGDKENKFTIFTGDLLAPRDSGK